MQRKIVKKNGYNAGKGKANQELIYLHMSNHYRRILNAKKVVDNSPPHSYKVLKTKRPATSNPVPTRINLNRPLESPALTDRSLSTNSYKGSCWGTDSNLGSSRYHSNCVPSDANNANAARHSKRPDIDMDLIDRITFDTKNGPAAYCDEAWIREKSQYSHKAYQPGFEAKRNNTTTANSSTSQHQKGNHPPNKSGDESEPTQKFSIRKKLNSVGALKGNKTFGTPKVFKTEAVSKLRSMRVYHPPRRRKARSKMETPPKTMETTDCDCSKICICEAADPVHKKPAAGTKEQSQTSSRDSAYNGGISSLPESRSPTPDHGRKQKSEECCCCCCCEKEKGKSAEATKGTKCSKGGSCPLPPGPKAPQPQDSLRKMKQDALYVKFVQDITVEVLERNLYTNKALKKVMKKHLRSNLQKLNKERMLQELESLRIQLGIPEDKSLLDVEADAEEVASDTFRLYPVISDSEFSLPGNLVPAPEAGGGAPGVPKSISEVMERELGLELELELERGLSSEADDEDLASAVQAKKAAGERRREKGGGRGRSSDDSDRPSQPKKRSTGRGAEKPPRRYSPSTSESETSGEKFSRKGCPGGCPGGCGREDGERKSRNVSFWSNGDVKAQAVGCRAGAGKAIP